VLEKFFDCRVAAPPYRPNALMAFARILQCPPEPLKDFASIARLEVQPELVAQQVSVICLDNVLLVFKHARFTLSGLKMGRPHLSYCATAGASHHVLRAAWTSQT
jgi:hypothetical protein